ncbi:GNAT family N-acetyltransferase [Methanoplanus sp. FWC-SCC4]|uniref:GNAT family N-acetyltransferase n=1 Tax=Methanochimaera problematica TaxID=2609417 RepID=A0AA97I2L3_9EURY|nr:GNAT family N-acetyltransferase [Methanoplanus sp. FWC-SCC4]WOF15733.1 GNAT family N-acetyltransferase [Methanoplanus sp. FWC-SCC4]
MSNDSIEILFVSEWPAEDIVELYRHGNWWEDEWDSEGIKPLISGSFIFAVAVLKDKRKAIGMGRVISDSVSDGYIQDLVVHRDFRGKGIGKKILNSLTEECKKRGLTWIGLIAEPDTEKFYKSEGFSVMKDHIPMLYGK